MEIGKILKAIFILILFIYMAYILLTKPRREGELKNVVMWIGIFCLLVVLYAFRFELDWVKDRVISVLIPSYSWSNDKGELFIARAEDGHFYLDAIAGDNQIIHFLIDTGASDVALTKEDAIRLGFDPDKLSYTQKYYTANGISYAAPVKIKHLTIRKKTFYNVPAHVTSGELDTSLLGMSVINDFANFRITRDTLILQY